jgi:hypothetical protein
MEDPKATAEPAAYEAPEITDYGSLTEITAEQATGALTDGSFPANTPLGDVTFS